MANTQPAQFRFTLVDELTTRAPVVIYALVDPTNDLNTHLANLNSFGRAIEAVTGLIVSRAEFVTMDETGFAHLAATPGIRVEDGMLLNLANSVNSHRWGLFIPGIDPAILSGNHVNLANANVVTLVTDLTVPFGGGEATTPHLEPINAVKDVRLVARKYRRQLLRTTFERV